MMTTSQHEHEATGSSSYSYGGDMASGGYAFTPSSLPRTAGAAAATSSSAAARGAHPGGCRDQEEEKPARQPSAEVIALSPRTVVATNRFVCEICNKGFQRDQNLQLHRRGHKLPWRLRRRNGEPAAAAPRKRVYVCPEPTCGYHNPARALGDLTGIKKHFSRKHGEKRWRCDHCRKRYAVQSDWKAHVKGCGTRQAREYRCACGILFSRKDSLLSHRAFCDALAEESARLLAAANNSSTITTTISSRNNDLHNTNSITPLFLPFSNSPPVVAAAQNPNNTLFFLHQEAELSPFLQPTRTMMMQQPSPYLDLHMHVGASITSTGTGGGASVLTDTPAAAVNFGLTLDEHRVEELQLPLCATASAAASRTASGATDLTTGQYLGAWLPSVDETWSHNF